MQTEHINSQPIEHRRKRLPLIGAMMVRLTGSAALQIDECTKPLQFNDNGSLTGC
jgi:hypothetical protein